MDYNEYCVVPMAVRTRTCIQTDGVSWKTNVTNKVLQPVSTVTEKPDDDDYGNDADDDEVSKAVAAAFGRCQKKKPILVVDDSDDPGSDSDYDASSESESSATNKTEKSEKTDKTDVEFDYASDNDSEDEMRAEDQVRRTIVKHQDTMGLLGTAEQLRRKSANGQASQTTAGSKKASSNSMQATLPPQYYPLTYPTGDPDVGEGFQLSGFLNGKRVYRLESEYLSRLRSMVVKTGVGLCYLDIESMLPPKVVQVPADKDNKDTEMAMDTDLATPPSMTLQVSNEVTQLSTSLASMSLATSPTSSQPLSPSSMTQPPSVLAEQPHLEVNDCFVVRPSTLGGVGAFALHDLVRGQHILVERPLLRTSLFNMPHELGRLAPEQRAQFDALTGHHPDPYASTAERIWTANTFDAGGTEAIFAVASRFNHACVPRNNIGYHFDRRKNVLIMTAIKKIAAGTELVITYGKSPSELFLRFGFRCVCGACSGFTEEMSRQQQLRSWSG